MRSAELSVKEIRDGLSNQNVTIGSEIVFFPLTGSTNTEAVGLAAKGQREGTVIIADSQTEGRGRRGRTWVSPAGKNLYLSIIVRPGIPPKDASILTLMSAVACTSAIQSLSSVPVSIKWPNDLMVADKKIGGILTEMKADADSIDYAVIGIGINLNLDSSDMPDNIRETATSVMLQTGHPQSRTLYALEIIKSLDYWYTTLLQSGKGPVIDKWKSLSSTIGRTVTATTGEMKLTGLAEGIDNEGLLILRLQDSSVVKINAGDVTILRQGC
ncbi:MAG: biotin--[acetyl-CoA-carboxylase] ligase [Dissulfurispiraceae bacterium]